MAGPDSPSSDDPADDPPDAEERLAQEKRTASAYVVLRAIADEAREELDRPTASLAWSGLAAGLSIGFSFVAEALLTHHLAGAGAWKPLVTKFGYSLGFLIVVLGRQQLFTENTLTPVLPLLQHRDRKTLAHVARLWAVVFVTNMAGCALFALAMAHAPLFEDGVRPVMRELAEHALEPGFGTIVVRGIFAGWLIALMVWLLPVAESGRIAVIVILTYTIGVARFSHVVAGSVLAYYLAIVGGTTWTHALGGFVLPALIGNVIGGTALVAALNYAQAVKGEKE